MLKPKQSPSRWSVALHDRTFEIHGVRGFRKFVLSLPSDPVAALSVLLRQLGVPAELWEDFLLCNALMSPGWSAWTQYQKREARRVSKTDPDFAGLMAIRLAYEAALAKHLNFQVDWGAIADAHFWWAIWSAGVNRLGSAIISVDSHRQSGSTCTIFVPRR
jgi:uncharacterized protein YbcC (UPF0753/DUF2309 family)